MAAAFYAAAFCMRPHVYPNVRGQLGIIERYKSNEYDMKTLRETIAWAEENKVAIGHFNFSDSTQLWAIFNAARALDVPVIVGLSEGERNFFGVRQAAVMVQSIREEYNYPIYLNADHTYTIEGVKEAIDAGFDAVIYDATKDGHEHNVANTKECVAYARASGRDVLVEAEMGNIGQSSSMWDEAPASVEDDVLTDPEMLKRFVEETGVDLIAPAVGNLHGMAKSGRNPELNIERIKELRQQGGIPMVLHGGSGISDEDFTAAIEAGISCVHINTEIRKAYRDGVAQFTAENPEEVAPYRFMKQGQEEMQEVVAKRLALFSRM